MVWGLLSVKDSTGGCSFDVSSPRFLVAVCSLILSLSDILVIYNAGISVWMCFIQFGRKSTNNTLRELWESSGERFGCLRLHRGAHESNL